LARSRADAGGGEPVFASVSILRRGAEPAVQPGMMNRNHALAIYCNVVDKGGHFAAWKQPELFARELRAAFTSLR
jgi:hypothetical protein